MNICKFVEIFFRDYKPPINLFIASYFTPINSLCIYVFFNLALASIFESIAQKVINDLQLSSWQTRLTEWDLYSPHALCGYAKSSLAAA